MLEQAADFNLPTLSIKSNYQTNSPVGRVPIAGPDQEVHGGFCWKLVTPEGHNVIFFSIVRIFLFKILPDIGSTVKAGCN